MKYSTSCTCREINLYLELPKPIESYTPRKCDCEFCVSHELSYISDVNGNLSIISRLSKLAKLEQGSEQAQFLQCLSCNQIVAVTYDFSDEIRGAVNGGIFSREYTLNAPVTVSPKFLSPAEKRERWLSSWLIVNVDA